MTEPMTDAPHRPIDVQSILDRLRRVEGSGGGWINTVTLRSDEARAILDHIGAYAEHCVAMGARLDAERTRADAAEAERDAALARAMPEAQLIQTKEEAAQLPAGIYYISPVEAGEGWFAVEALDTVAGPRWLYPDDSYPRGDHMIAGCFVIRLPDLPTPTAAQEDTTHDRP